MTAFGYTLSSEEHSSSAPAANVHQAEASGFSVLSSSDCCHPRVRVQSHRQSIKAGYDHVYFHQIGPDQAGFFDFWKEELSPELADLEPV